MDFLLFITIILIAAFGRIAYLKYKRASLENSPEVQADIKRVEDFIAAIENYKRDYWKNQIGQPEMRGL